MAKKKSETTSDVKTTKTTKTKTAKSKAPVAITRECSFKPGEYIEVYKDKEDKEFSYLPAYARMLWFNTYLKDTGARMSLTSKCVNRVGGKIFYRATLTELLTDANGNFYSFVIATGDSTVFEGDYDAEFADTRAKARCLATAGFSLREERKDFDEGSSPCDGPLPAAVSVTTDQPEQMTFDVPDAFETPEPALEGPTFPPIVADEQTDEEKLKEALKGFFPFSPFKGDRAVDICENPKFIEKINWILGQTFSKDKIIEGTSMNWNEWAKIFERYCIKQTDEDLLTFIRMKKEVLAED